MYVSLVSRCRQVMGGFPVRHVSDVLTAYIVGVGVVLLHTESRFLLPRMLAYPSIIKQRALNSCVASLTLPTSERGSGVETFTEYVHL